MSNLDSYDPICVYLVNTPNTGHQMAGAEVIKQIRLIAPEKEIKILYEEKTTDASKNAKEKVSELKLLEGIPVTWEPIQEDSFGKKKKNGLVIFPAYDDIDNKNVEKEIQKIQQKTGCDQCLILQPCNWTHPRAMAIGNKVYNEDSFIPKECLPLYKTEHYRSLNSVLGFDKASPEIKKIAEDVEVNAIDIVPMYGVHQLPKYGILEYVALNAATLKKEGKPLVMLDPTNKFVSPEILEKLGITFIDLKNPSEDLNSLLNDPLKTLFIKTGRIPSDVYDYLLGKATLALYEGSNTLQQILNNQNPRFLSVSAYGQTPLPNGKSMKKTQEMALKLVHPISKTSDEKPVVDLYNDFVKNFNAWIVGKKEISEVIPLPDKKVFSEEARNQLKRGLEETAKCSPKQMDFLASTELYLDKEADHQLYQKLLYSAFVEHSLERKNDFVEDFNAWILGEKEISEVIPLLGKKVFTEEARNQLKKGLEETAESFAKQCENPSDQVIQDRIKVLLENGKLNLEREADNQLYQQLFDSAFEEYSLQRKKDGNLKSFDISEMSDYLKEVAEGKMEYQTDLIHKAQKPESDQLRAGLDFLNINMLIKNLSNEIDKEILMLPKKKMVHYPKFGFAPNYNMKEDALQGIDYRLKRIANNLSTLSNSLEVQKQVLSDLKEIRPLLESHFGKKEWTESICHQIDTLSNTLLERINIQEQHTLKEKLHAENVHPTPTNAKETGDFFPH